MSVDYHIPVLLHQTVDVLVQNPDGLYVDLTFGGGGHSREILSRLSDKGRLLAFDQDQDTLSNRIEDDRFTFVRSNFRYLTNFLHYHGVDKVDGILADIGVSSHHFDQADRGFSYRFDAPLDMRMNQKAYRSAAEIVNGYTQERLADIFYQYGELRQSRRVASLIVSGRQRGAINTVGEFLELLKPILPKDNDRKILSQVFQALRIEVNDELGALRQMLLQADRCLKPGGRLAIITFHSLEDRMVKNFLRSGNIEGEIKKDFYGNVLSQFQLVSSKALVADEQELLHNPRSRSAKLRVAYLK